MDNVGSAPCNIAPGRFWEGTKEEAFDKSVENMVGGAVVGNGTEIAVGAGGTVPVTSFTDDQLKAMSTRCVLAPDATIAGLTIDYDENQGTTIV